MFKTDDEKSYLFNNSHDPSKPAYLWFQNPPEGLTAYVVFYALACRWGKCTMCNIPSAMSSKPVSSKNLKRQIDHFLGVLLPVDTKTKIKKIIAAVGGSILDEKAFPRECLEYLVLKIVDECLEICVLTLETRVQHVNFKKIEHIKDLLNKGKKTIALELAVGLETSNEFLRNKRLNKGLTDLEFEKFCKNAALHDVCLKVFLMQKPLPDMTEEKALEDVCESIDYLSEKAKKYNLHINAHLNPAYIAIGTVLEHAYKKGLYAPPLLKNVCRAVLSAEGKNVTIFIGLNDEGLTRDEARIAKIYDRKLIKTVELFNSTQDFALLKSAL